MTLLAQNASFSTLLAAARAGDGTSLGQLLKRAEPRLLKCAEIELTGRLRGREADLVQDTLKDAVMAFDQFTGHSESGWHQWLKRILKNNLTDMYRRNRASKRDAAKEQRLDTDYDLTDGGETPSKAAVRDEDLKRLSEALLALSARDRLVIQLHDTDRLPFAEIAQMMGKPSPDAARKLYERAQSRLKEAFDAQ